MSDIKMSEVFNLPIKSHGHPALSGSHKAYPVISASAEGELIKGIFGKVVISQGQHTGTSRYLDEDLAVKMASSICLAVNNHDRLVEENAQLKADKEELIDYLRFIIESKLLNDHSNIEEEAEKLLIKLKGVNL